MTVTDLERQLLKSFKKAELFAIATELKIKKLSTTTPDIQIIRAVFDSLDNVGVPTFKTCSDVLAEFLVAGEVYDEKGNLIEPDENPDPEVLAPTTILGKELPKPPCFMFVDDSDPACKKCKLIALCREEHIKNRPPCYGQSYEVTAVECQECILAFMCKEVFTKEVANG